jgi:RNA polymerase sigma-70 factor (ECF subfamily)
MTGDGRWQSFDVMGHLEALRRYARSLTRDESSADDLVHDALLRAYEAREGFRLGGALRPWLLAILHNTFISGWRSRKGEQARLDQAATVSRPEVPMPAQEAAVQLGQVRRAFAALPDEQRAALYLVAIEGMSYHEASTTLDVPLGTLMSRISRARAALRAVEQAAPDDVIREARAPYLRIVGGSRDTD